MFRAFCNLVIITILYCYICEYYMLVLSAIFSDIYPDNTHDQNRPEFTNYRKVFVCHICRETANVKL